MGRERQMGDGASKTTEERRDHRGSAKGREGQRSRWGWRGEERKGAGRKMQEEASAGVPVVQGRVVMVGIVRRAWGLASSAQAESSAARAPGRHLLHHLEESHRCTTPACSGFSDSVHPPWAPPLTTQVSETSRSYFYPYFTDEEPEAQRNVWNCTWHTVSNICSC